MLKRLTIRDYVLFDRLDLDLGEGLNVISGETGGGKSNLTTALGLLAGGRARRDQIRKGSDTAVIAGVLEVQGRSLLVERTLTVQGQGRCTIDGQPASLAALREAVGDHVSISGQHDQMSLVDPDTHRRILDEFGGLDDLREAYAGSFERSRRLAADLASLRAAGKDRAYRQEWLSHQIREIRALDPVPGEDESLDRDIRMLANAERISGALAKAASILYESEGSCTESMAVAEREIEDVRAFLSEAGGWLASIAEARTLVEEAARAISSRHESMDMDPAALQSKQERAFALQGLKKKHGPGLTDVIEKLASMERESATLSDLGAATREAEKALAAEALRARELAGKLTGKRRKEASKLAKRIVLELADLAFDQVILDVVVAPRPQSSDPLSGLDETGADEVRFMFGPNPGEDPKPLEHIASGGELSRVFLAIRAALGRARREGLLVFDEADTGIGGKVADALGLKLHMISRTRQVLCVTHLAQIAAYADVHILVDKVTDKKRTTSRARSLDDEGRRDEMARMLGGERITARSRDAASELVALARSRMEKPR